MKEFKICFDKNTLVQTEHNIWGVLYWQYRGETFPDDNWDDIVSVILGWWTSSLIRLLNKGSVFESLWYMDGPCRIDIRVQNGCDTNLKCYHTALQSSPRAEWNIPLKTVARKLFLASTRFLEGYPSCIKKESEYLSGNIRYIADNCNAIRKYIS
jgi:hypothetical protein